MEKAPCCSYTLGWLFRYCAFGCLGSDADGAGRVSTFQGSLDADLKTVSALVGEGGAHKDPQRLVCLFFCLHTNHSFSSLLSSRSLLHLASTLPPLHPSISIQKGQDNKAWHIQLRQNQAPPPCNKAGQGISP